MNTLTIGATATLTTITIATEKAALYWCASCTAPCGRCTRRPYQQLAVPLRELERAAALPAPPRRSHHAHLLDRPPASADRRRR